MSIDNSQMAQITARAGVGRAGTMRADVTFRAEELKANVSGQIFWNRAVASDGNPDDTVAEFTRVRQ